MIPVEKALAIVLERTPRLPAEEVSLADALGRVLAEDAAADSDLPPFPRSAVDGYAVRAREARESPARLAVVGTVPAGAAPAFALREGEAAQIMTGAPLPEGADAVQMVEKTREAAPGEVEILEPVEPGANVAPRGSEVRAGEPVLKRGAWIDPAALAVLATVGKSRVLVGRRPAVAVAATGDELVDPAERPGPGQIRNSNGFSLAAQAQLAGARVTALGVARDDAEALRSVIERGFASDVLLLSGGVSMGRYDLVEDALARLGVEILVDAVALKPGKPLVFGVGPGGQLTFGLPGNPVSTLVTFELFVKPALLSMQGSERPTRPELSATLSGPLASRGPRRAYLPGWISPAGPAGALVARPIPTRGSADIVAFSKANALLVLPEELDLLPAGEAVRVVPLDNFFVKEDRWPARD
jgi:molybdopterin molybdotransferase